MRVAQRQPDEVALGVGDVQPWSRSAAATRVRSATMRVDPLEQLGLRPSEATAAAWATEETPNGSAQARTAAATRALRPGSRPGARPGRRPWRRSASPRRSARVAVERDPVDRVVVADELPVGLVEHDHARRAAPRSRKAAQLGAADGGAGRVVRRADQHDLGAVGDRRGHRVEVVPCVRGQRHLHRRPHPETATAIG